MNKILLRIAADNIQNEKNDNADNDINDDININIKMDSEDDINIEDNNLNDDKQNENDEADINNDELELNNNDRSMLEEMITDDPFDDSNLDYNNISSRSPKNNMQNQLIENMFYNLSQDGRGILKHIEDYRFKMIQTLNILNGQNELKTKVEQKQKILESAAAQIYGIVFDLENYRLTPNYEEEQFAGEALPETDNTYNEDAFANTDINDDSEINEIDEQESKDLDEETTNTNDNTSSPPMPEPTDDTELQGGFDEEEITEEK